MDMVFSRYVKMYGFNAAVRMCKNLGIPFEDTYYMAFGRMP